MVSNSKHLQLILRWLENFIFSTNAKKQVLSLLSFQGYRQNNKFFLWHFAVDS
jgi:hypothetical protein